MQSMLLKDVSRQSYRSRIIIRLARMWEFRDPQTGSTLYELDFVVVDRENGTMEGYVPNNRIDQFRALLREGIVYTFEQFVVTNARSTYKAVEHPYRIRFTQRTKVKEMVAHPENFPTFAYTALPFATLATRINNNTLLSDVVGLIKTITDVSMSPTTQQPKRQIYITDDSGQRVVVTLWGEFADAFDGLAFQKISANEPVVVLFVGMTVGEFSGMLAFKSTSVTKWYVNIPVPEVASLRLSSKNAAYQIEWQGSARPKSEPVETTIADLLKNDPYGQIGERFKLNILLTDIVATESWYYMSCKLCWKKTYLEGDMYRCRRCTNGIGEPRYKIVYEGVDAQYQGDDIAPIAHFTFFGAQGKKITGKDEALLISEVVGQESYVPTEISAAVGKKYVLIADLGDNSLDSDWLCFQVSSSEEMFDVSTPEKHGLLTDPPVEIPSVIVEVSENLSTPPPTLTASTGNTPSNITRTTLPVEKATSQTRVTVKRDMRKRAGVQQETESKKSAKTTVSRTLTFPHETSSSPPTDTNPE